MSYLPGIGWSDSDPATPRDGAHYTHGDQIGTLRAISDQQSAVTSRLVYTAFGEQVFADGEVGPRYQYAGEYGYETSVGQDAQFAGIPFLHVGFRWYDPSTGRFLQRDPLGMHNPFNANVYEYVGSRPLQRVDPSGLWDEGMHDWEVLFDPFDRYPPYGNTDECMKVRETAIRKIGNACGLLLGNPWSTAPRLVKGVFWGYGIYQWIFYW